MQTGSPSWGVVRSREKDRATKTDKVPAPRTFHPHPLGGGGTGLHEYGHPFAASDEAKRAASVVDVVLASKGNPKGELADSHHKATSMAQRGGGGTAAGVVADPLSTSIPVEVSASASKMVASWEAPASQQQRRPQPDAAAARIPPGMLPYSPFMMPYPPLMNNAALSATPKHNNNISYAKAVTAAATAFHSRINNTDAAKKTRKAEGQPRVTAKKLQQKVSSSEISMANSFMSGKGMTAGELAAALAAAAMKEKNPAGISISDVKNSPKMLLPEIGKTKKSSVDMGTSKSPPAVRLSKVPSLLQPTTPATHSQLQQRSGKQGHAARPVPSPLSVSTNTFRERADSSSVVAVAQTVDSSLSATAVSSGAGAMVMSTADSSHADSRGTVSVSDMLSSSRISAPMQGPSAGIVAAASAMATGVPSPLVPTQKAVPETAYWRHALPSSPAASHKPTGPMTVVNSPARKQHVTVDMHSAQVKAPRTAPEKKVAVPDRFPGISTSTTGKSPVLVVAAGSTQAQSPCGLKALGPDRNSLTALAADKEVCQNNTLSPDAASEPSSLRTAVADRSIGFIPATGERGGKGILVGPPPAQASLTPNGQSTVPVETSIAASRITGTLLTDDSSAVRMLVANPLRPEIGPAISPIALPPAGVQSPPARAPVKKKRSYKKKAKLDKECLGDTAPSDGKKKKKRRKVAGTSKSASTQKPPEVDAATRVALANCHRQVMQNVIAGLQQEPQTALKAKKPKKENTPGKNKIGKEIDGGPVEAEDTETAWEEAEKIAALMESIVQGSPNAVTNIVPTIEQRKLKTEHFQREKGNEGNNASSKEFKEKKIIDAEMADKVPRKIVSSEAEQSQKTLVDSMQAGHSESSYPVTTGIMDIDELKTATLNNSIVERWSKKLQCGDQSSAPVLYESHNHQKEGDNLKGYEQMQDEGITVDCIGETQGVSNLLKPPLSIEEHTASLPEALAQPQVKRVRVGLAIPRTLEEVVRRASAVVAEEIRLGSWNTFCSEENKSNATDDNLLHVEGRESNVVLPDKINEPTSSDFGNDLSPKVTDPEPNLVSNISVESHQHPRVEIKHLGDDSSICSIDVSNRSADGCKKSAYAHKTEPYTATSSQNEKVNENSFKTGFCSGETQTNSSQETTNSRQINGTEKKSYNKSEAKIREWKSRQSMLHSVATAIERFATEIILPSLQSAGVGEDVGEKDEKCHKNRKAPYHRAFIATLLALREILTINADAIFFDSRWTRRKNVLGSSDGDCGMADDLPRKRRHERIESEEAGFRSRLLATAVILSAIDRLDSVSYSTISSEFIQAVEKYDEADEEFSFCLERADGRSRCVTPGGRVLGREEAVAWRVSFNEARERHPLIQVQKRRDAISRFAFREAVWSGNQNGLTSRIPKRITIPSPNACSVYILERLPSSVVSPCDIENDRKSEEENNLETS